MTRIDFFPLPPSALFAKKAPVAPKAPVANAPAAAGAAAAADAINDEIRAGIPARKKNPPRCLAL